MTIGRFLKVAAALNLGLAVLAVGVTALLADGNAVTGVAVGGLLGTANLVGLAWLGGGLVTPGGAKWPWALGLALKFALLILVVFLAIRYVPMDVIGFVAGLSASGLAIVGQTAWMAARKVELTP